MGRYTFPLCIQLTPPDDIFSNEGFSNILKTLQKRGFYGVELNIADFSQDPLKLVDFLGGYGLRLTMIASGVYANRNGLSLSHADETVRQRTVDEFKKILSFAKETGAGIICGFIKGGAGANRQLAQKQMLASLFDLKADVEKSGVDVFLEATNHYEATLVNTVDEIDIFSQAGACYKVLPDTYHMNIEEKNMAATLARYRKLYRNVHVSDNNRYYPGFGAIDFYSVLSTLKGLNYDGLISIEGRNLFSIEKDIEIAADYLENVSARIDL